MNHKLETYKAERQLLTNAIEVIERRQAIELEKQEQQKKIDTARSVMKSVDEMFVYNFNGSQQKIIAIPKGTVKEQFVHTFKGTLPKSDAVKEWLEETSELSKKCFDSSQCCTQDKEIVSTLKMTHKTKEEKNHFDQALVKFLKKYTHKHCPNTVINDKTGSKTYPLKQITKAVNNWSLTKVPKDNVISFLKKL